jgi:prefoldin subunit 5
MPLNEDLAAAADAILEAGKIVNSTQYSGRIPNIKDEHIKVSLGMLYNAAQHQNMALENLRAAIEKLEERIDEL